MQPKLTVPPAVIFSSLIRRAAAGLAHAKLARCPRCKRVTLHPVAAETVSTGETLWACEVCGQGQAL